MAMLPSLAPLMPTPTTFVRALSLPLLAVFALPSCFTALWIANRGQRDVQTATAGAAHAVTDQQQHDPWFCVQLDAHAAELLDLQPEAGTWLWVHPEEHVEAVSEVLRNAAADAEPRAALVVGLTTSHPLGPAVPAPPVRTFELSTVAAAPQSLPGLEISGTTITTRGTCTFELHAERRVGGESMRLAGARVQRTRVQPAQFGTGNWLELPLMVALDTGLVLLAVAVF